MLGRLLHRLRVEADISSDDAADVIRASRSKISRMETGRVSFKNRDVTDLLSRYGVTDPGTIAKVAALARRANAPGWWTQYADVTADWFAEYLGLETAASLIRTFETQFVPGLFQTPEYARAVLLLGNSARCARRDRAASGTADVTAERAHRARPARRVVDPGRGRHPAPGRRPGRHRRS